MSLETKKAIEFAMKDFLPSELTVIDDSDAHRGHLAALEHPEAGHYKLIMKSAQFNGLNQVARHRLVYQKLGFLMDKKIHAITLDLKADGE
jgi:BolA protein